MPLICHRCDGSPSIEGMVHTVGICDQCGHVSDQCCHRHSINRSRMTDAECERARQQLLDSLTEAMAADCMSDEERMVIMDHLESKFCRGCGIVLNGKTCHCRNDD